MYWPNSLCCSVQFSYLFASSYILPWIACHALLSRVKLRLGNLVTRPLNMIHWWYHNCCHNVCTKMPFLIETLIFCGHLLLEPNEWKTSIGLGYNKVVFRIALFDKSRVLSDLAPRMVPYREREKCAQRLPQLILCFSCLSCLIIQRQLHFTNFCLRLRFRFVHLAFRIVDLTTHLGQFRICVFQLGFKMTPRGIRTSGRLLFYLNFLCQSGNFCLQSLSTFICDLGNVFKFHMRWGR